MVSAELGVGVVNEYTDGVKSGYRWYFEVDGVRKLEVTRPLTYSAEGLCVVFGEGNESYMRQNGSYTVITDVGYVLTEYDEVKKYDYEDLSGEYKGLVSQAEIGAFEEKVNAALTVKAKTDGAPFGFTLSDLYTVGYGDGKYFIESGDTVLAEKELAHSDTAELEFGFKNCYHDGEFAGVSVYLNANGEEVVSYLDKTTDFTTLDGSVKKCYHIINR